MSAGRKESLNPSVACSRSYCLPGGPASGAASPPTYRESREPTTPGPSCQIPGVPSGAASEAHGPGGTSGRLPQPAPTRETQCTAVTPGCQSPSIGQAQSYNASRS